jgi:hypothetical protein
MANYSTLLKTWGATGIEYPNGYSYIEGEQPVDDWDNYFAYNAVEDLDHLISLTNKRIETGSGTSFPTSPDSNHAFYRSDEERLYAYNSTQSSWEGLISIEGDTMRGDLDLGGHTLKGIGALSMDGVIDLENNDLKDSSNGKLLYDASASHIPLDALEHDAVTVNTDSHISGAQTVTLGNSISLGINDDFVENTGDKVTGELTGERSTSSRVFTASDSATGDKLSLRIDGSDNFQLVGYDSSDGAWDYASALEYNPGTEDWDFGTLPSVNGDLIATQTYSDANYVNEEDTEISQQDGGSVGYNTFVPVGTFGLDDGEQLYVTRATLTKNGFDTACESGVNLTIAVSNGDTVQVLSGDGTTLYDDENGDPISQYTNSTGGHVSVAIGIDNGHYGTGFGDDTSAYAGFNVRKY